MMMLEQKNYRVSYKEVALDNSCYILTSEVFVTNTEGKTYKDILRFVLDTKGNNLGLMHGVILDANYNTVAGAPVRYINMKEFFLYVSYIIKAGFRLL